MGHAVHPSTGQGAVGCEKTAVRQAPKIQQPPGSGAEEVEPSVSPRLSEVKLAQLGEKLSPEDWTLAAREYQRALQEDEP